MRVLSGIAALLVFADAVPSEAQTRYGVFVGINDYVEYVDEPGGDLQGAEADALLMRQVLTEHWGLAEENTLTLLSLQATKAAIHEAVTVWLAERAGPGDLAIFYFAGHGAQAYDLDGDETDALDETLAPTDVLPLSSENDIRDDEFREWLSMIGTQVVVILDSCHSGSATRGSEMRTRSLERPPPLEGGREPALVRQQYDAESMADGSSTIIELAGAAPNQSALEGPFVGADGVTSEQRGAFTFFLAEALRTASPETTYADILAAVADRLDGRDFLQNPQLAGAGATRLFAAPSGGR